MKSTIKEQLSKVKGKIQTTAVSDSGITPVIIVCDSLLKLHKLIDLNTVDFYHGRQCEEFPSFTYSKQVYSTMLDAKIKFRVECDQNPDPENLSLACVSHDFGKLKWFTPNYQLDHDDQMFDVKLALVESPKKVKYTKMCVTDLRALIAEGEWKLMQLAGGRLSKKQADRLNLSLVEGSRFSFYQAK